MLGMYDWPLYDDTTTGYISKHLLSPRPTQWEFGGLNAETAEQYASANSSKHAHLTSSGHTALVAILMALNLPRGSYVAIPALCFIRVATPLASLGLIPLVVDVEPDTGNLCPYALKRALGKFRVSAAICIHMWGVPCDVQALLSACNAQGVPLIEDCSHAHFSSVNGVPVGNFGVAGFASIQRKKVISVGEGGVITTNNSELSYTLAAVVSPGHPEPSDMSGYGWNFRISPLSSMLLQHQLDNKDAIIACRGISEPYLRGLLTEVGVVCPLVPDYSSHITWYDYKVKSKATLSNRKLWRIKPFKYADVLSHPFWDKPIAHTSARPVLASDTPGYHEYYKDRWSVDLPTRLDHNYWAKYIKSWGHDLYEVKGCQLV